MFIKLTYDASKTVLDSIQGVIQVVLPLKGSSSILGIPVGGVLTKGQVCKAIVLVKCQQNNLAEVLTVGVRHKIVQLVKQENRTETKMWSAAESRKEDRIEQVNSGLHRLHAMMLSFRPPPNPKRLGWSTWPIPTRQYDKHYLPQMQKYRESKRDSYSVGSDKE